MERLLEEYAEIDPYFKGRVRNSQEDVAHLESKLRFKTS